MINLLLYGGCRRVLAALIVRECTQAHTEAGLKERKGLFQAMEEKAADCQ